MSVDISLGHWMYQRSQSTPNRPALTFEGITWTYAELQLRIDKLAATLKANGIGFADRVGFLGVNQPAYFEALFATARLGAIFVPLNFRLTGPELSYIIEDAGVHTLIVDNTHQPIIDSVRADLTCQNFWSADIASKQWPAFQTLTEAHVPITDGAVVSSDDTAIIMYTSGTTGLPKGAMLTHSNLWWNNINMMCVLDVMEDDVSLVIAPLFHIGGLNVTTLVTWIKGGHNIVHRSFDPEVFFKDVEKYRVTSMFAVPAILLFISQHPAFGKSDLSSLRMIPVGGAPLSEQLLQVWSERGIALSQGYGMTEACPLATMLSAEFTMRKIGSAGRTLMTTELVLAEPNGTTFTTPNKRGEIYTRGPNIMKGYWNKPDATAETIDSEGWFHSGDVGYFDDDGFLFVVDRVKDMIITGGENVYPAEVENALYKHPAIIEVAVIGLPDEQWGETVVAVAALKEGCSLELEELRNFAGKTLAKYKVPRRLEILESLPHNPAGKVLKFELRKMF